MDPRARIDEKVIAAWAQSQHVHGARWRRASRWLLALSAALVVAALFKLLPWVVPIFVIPPVWVFAAYVIQGLRRCPACGKYPFGERRQPIEDYCLHCLHWLKHPLRRTS